MPEQALSEPSADRTAAVVHIGVGLDTARYGHHASFLGEDRQPPIKDFPFPESHAGYAAFTTALQRLADRHGAVHFHIHLDVAGNYALNLEAFLHTLPFQKTISLGEPKRNKDYRNAHFPKRKADAVDSLACARFALVERPKDTAPTPKEFLLLRELAGALQAQRTKTTRCVNQLHNRLARVFPELALLATDISAAWVLKLLDQYPTPQRIAAARLTSLTRIPHVDADRAEKLQTAARTSTASLTGKLAEQLLRQSAEEVRLSQQAEARLVKLLEQAFDALPEGGHRQLLTIPGIGRRTAAALVAKIVSLDRFETPADLVSYFGGFPEENTSGVDKHNRPIPQGTPHMSAKGNDLVRSLLWMACQSAIQCNPAIRALYARQKAKGKRGDVALGHCFRKMLHLVYALWKTNRPFDPNHFPWEPRSAQTSLADQPASPPSVVEQPVVEQPVAVVEQPVVSLGAQEDAAGLTGQSPKRTEVTAAPVQQTTRNLPQDSASGKQFVGAINFAQVRRQIRLSDVLEDLGQLQRLRGSADQRTGPCPIHEPEETQGRHFSVHLGKGVFRCFHPACGAQGNVLDFWAAFKHLPLRDAAADLAARYLPEHSAQPPLTQERRP